MSLFDKSVLKKLGADSSIHGDKSNVAFFRALYMLTDGVSIDEYVRSKLPHETAKHRGRKRLRKKKAVAALRQRWGFLQIGWTLTCRSNYSAMGRELFRVEPLPMGALPIYDKDPDVAAWVTGSHEEDEG